MSYVPRPSVSSFTDWLLLCNLCGSGEEGERGSGKLSWEAPGSSQGLDGGGWRKYGQRRDGGRDRASTPDPDTQPGPSGWKCFGVPHFYRPVRLPGDVVWRIPVGAGLFALLSYTRWTDRFVYFETPQIWEVHVCGNPADGNCGTNICRDINKCCHCWSVQSCCQGNDPL